MLNTMTGFSQFNQFFWRKPKLLQATIFLALWPLANLLFATATMVDVGFFSFKLFFTAAGKIWVLFASSFAIISIIEYVFPSSFKVFKFWRLLAIYLAVFLSMSSLLHPIVTIPPSAMVKHVAANGLVMVLLQTTVYLGVMHLIQQQRRSFEIALTLQESELNMLRAQSNPHFLFNTLNLIVSEISNDADNAKEIVYDLADLLRSNIKMAQQKFTSLTDEVHLVELYLKLQQKRFKDRFSFIIDMDPETRDLKIPALLLQPIVENAIKHGVAPYAKKAHICIRTEIKDEMLRIDINDSGPPFNESTIGEADGLRIVRKTLSLHYPNQHLIELKSTPSGGNFRLQFPAQKYSQSKSQNNQLK